MKRSASRRSTRVRDEQPESPVESETASDHELGRQTNIKQETGPNAQAARPKVHATCSSAPRIAAAGAKTTRGLWSEEEDTMLLKLIDVYGPSRWVDISLQLKTRSAKQCRERYHQNLRPNLNKTPISKEEGETIKQLVAKHGFRWTLVAKLLQTNRSDNSIKNWWKTNVKKKQRNVFRDANPKVKVGQNSDTSSESAFLRSQNAYIQDMYHRDGSMLNKMDRNPAVHDMNSSCGSISPKSDHSSGSESNMRRPRDRTVQSAQYYDDDRRSVITHFNPLPHVIPVGPQSFVPHPSMPPSQHLMPQQQIMHNRDLQGNFIPAYPHYCGQISHISGNMYQTVVNPMADNRPNMAPNSIFPSAAAPGFQFTQNPNNPDEGCFEDQRQVYNAPPPILDSHTGHLITHAIPQIQQYKTNATSGAFPHEESKLPQHMFSQSKNLNTPVHLIQARNFIEQPNAAAGNRESLTTQQSSSSDSVPMHTTSSLSSNIQHQTLVLNQQYPSSRRNSTSKPPSAPNKLPSFEELTQRMNINSSNIPKSKEYS